MIMFKHIAVSFFHWFTLVCFIQVIYVIIIKCHYVNVLKGCICLRWPVGFSSLLFKVFTMLITVQAKFVYKDHTMTCNVNCVGANIWYLLFKKKIIWIFILSLNIFSNEQATKSTITIKLLSFKFIKWHLN